MKNNFNILTISTLSILLMSGCSKGPETPALPKSVEAIPVKVISLCQAEVTGSVQSSGQFTTDDETMLSFKTGGIVDRIYVKEGDRIRKGQLLATLDLTEISSQVNQTRIAYEKAARDYDRFENLRKDSVATLEQLQNAKTGLELAKQQLDAAKFNLQYSKIRATHDGVILRKLASEGQMTGQGMPVLQTSSKGRTDWILRVAVSDKEWADIKLNDKAIVQIEALNICDMQAFVSAKAEDADQMTGSFSIDLKLNNARQLNIASGMFGKAEIRLSQKNLVWQIPYDALLDGNADQGFVFVTNDHINALKVPVTIEAIDGKNILISKGLEEYKSLIVSGSAYLTDKSVIKVINNYSINK
ncbi:MAG: efflux RND transporter periplasmic adaptor subunit [Bacteroidetes bacterium]|nr:efflux RND transporter periplasmic adaptor subunit [Bacteroidota bacterium]